jgi:hypothetical protein
MRRFRSHCLWAAPRYAALFPLTLDGVRFWALQCRDTLLLSGASRSERQFAAAFFRSLFEENSHDSELFQCIFETVVAASARECDVATLSALLDCLACLSRSEFVVGGFLGLLFSQFVGIFRNFAAADFAGSAVPAEALAAVMGQLFDRARPEAVAFAAAHFIDGAGTEPCLLPFFELVWAELIASGTPAVAPAVLHDALRSVCGVCAHRRLADWYGAKVDLDWTEIGDFVDILVSARPVGWERSVVAVIGRFGRGNAEFEECARAVLEDGGEEAWLALAALCPEQLAPTVARAAAAEVTCECRTGNGAGRVEMEGT